MDVERERLIFDGLQRVLATPPGAREAAVLGIPGLDAAERGRLRELLLRAEAEEPLSAAAGPDAGPALLRRLDPGAILGDFELVRRLGEGGMGQVWEARQRSVGRPVALKLLKSGVVHGEDAVTRLRREAETAGNLSHPGIIAVYVAGEVDGVPFVAHELVRGGRDLGAWVRERDARGAPPGHAREAAGVMREVADAVAAAHDAGVVHRDLKPQNIMLREDGRPVVLDFGLAGLVGQPSGDVTELRIVSPAYQAPEQVRGRATGKDPRTDVYQLGVTLYELVTLRRAFGDSNRLALERRIVQADFPRPRAVARGVPWALEAIVLRAMALDPGRRYASAGALRDDLRRFVDGVEVPVAARGGPLLGGLRRLPYLLRRHRVASLAVGATLLGLTAGALAWAGADGDATVRPFKRSGAQAAVVAWADDDTAAPGDLLGVDLELPAPATIYALSAFGDRSPPSWVVPVDPVPRDGLLAEPALRRGPDADWGLTLPAGRHELIVSSLGEASRAVAHEGLVLLLAERPSPMLEQWLADLDRSSRLSDVERVTGQRGVAYEQARQLLADPDVSTRGTAPDLAPEQRAALARLRAVDVLGADELSVAGVRVQRVMWRVAGAATSLDR